MAHGSPVPELYKSIIEDVVEGVRELFAEEGVEEQVLKDLKQLWETKVTQSKATEGFFKHSHCSPRFSLQLPHSSHSILQTSAASYVIQAGRGFQHFTAAKLGPPRVGVTLAVPSCVAYPLQMPAGVMLQPAPGQLYKVNVPVVVTQASGDGSILHYPVQQMFHPLGQASVLQASLASVTQLNASAARAAGETLQPQETAVQQAVLFKPSFVEKQHLETSATLVQQPSVSLQEFEINAVLNQCSESTEKFQHDNLHTAVFTPECSEGLFMDESLASSSSSVLLDVEGQLDMEHPELLQQQVSDDIIDLIIAGEGLDENAFLKDQGSMASSDKTESDLPLEKDLCSDIEGISQLDGTGDVSSKEQIPQTKDKEENEFIGFIDSEDLRVLDDEEDYDEECDSSSNTESSCSDGDNENLQIDIVEEIHRTKNKWKFYLKDGVMSIEGKDHVFAKATGDAEW
ncbi:TFIIA-alpha and beta-like factor isoform X2 [Vidua macroura]|uniref:TFIIA-alpha and beta-like factor isoform X2 n=1 Tax=Vidua chalybeata TaxID=81927 RepID=UPI0023A8B20E|nr:TFIIA-alpha and beta-like factor isoform X2 [Vidua chalybeata]XP_053829829.1 TFIIA-alpha and beta-like factor isoform X2 [Vidua macroura]